MPRDEEIRGLVREWMRKADLDLRTVERLHLEAEFREVVCFHAQQAVEKYLKALLTRHQIEFPKTHELHRLLDLLRPKEPLIATALSEIAWLDPFGVEVRYPADRPDSLPGYEIRALGLARLTKAQVLTRLTPCLAQE